MPKKGVEPAGLRRWRLAHRRKGKSHRSGRSSSGGSDSPGFAAVYQQGKTALQITSGALDEVTSILSGTQTPGNVIPDLQARAANRDFRAAYGKGILVSILDAWGSRKTRHANALAQKSVTAAVPELYAVGTAIADNDLD